jgi:hypothetical protein
MTQVPLTDNEIAHVAPKASPWKMAFRVVRWTSYALALIALMLVMHTAPAPSVETSPQAAARVEEKLAAVEQAVSNGQPATLRMDQTELNSYLLSHVDIAANAAVKAAQASQTGAPSASQSANQTGSNVGAPGGAGTELPTTAVTAEQVEQVRSSVKDVKVQLIEDRVRAYVVFDFHGKDMTLQLEGKLAAVDGYLRFEPVGGQIGALPIPQSTLETAVQRMMDSPENREKLKLPADISDLRIENGEVVASYK